MRLLFAIVLLGMLMSGRAGASSFVALPPAAKQVSPSVIYFAGPEPQLAKAEPGDASPELPPLPTPELASPPRLAGAVAKPDEGSSVTVLSASVIALGARPLEFDFSHIAALDREERPRNPHLPPMVIRGGIFGDAFARGDGLEPVPQEEPDQQSVTNPPADAVPSGPDQPSGPGSSAPPVAIQPPAPPTGKMR